MRRSRVKLCNEIKDSTFCHQSHTNIAAFFTWIRWDRQMNFCILLFLAFCLLFFTCSSILINAQQTFSFKPIPFSTLLSTIFFQMLENSSKNAWESNRWCVCTPKLNYRQPDVSFGVLFFRPFFVCLIGICVPFSLSKPEKY